ncbi:MAG: sulfur reductase subunit SreA [Anaerolineae bacterium]|nr:MAG: sulfur reductase subunit SreA [Anaerolineae bacterium]
MVVTRRDFLKSSITVGGGALANSFLFGGLETLVKADPLRLAAIDEKWIPTTCWIGKQDCGMLARVIDGRVIGYEGNPAHPRNRGTLCPKGVAQITSLYDPNRVHGPLVRTNEKGVSGTWRQISWDEALELVGSRMAEVIAKDPGRLIWQKGRSKAKSFYDKAFVKTAGATKLHHGAFCSDAGYRALEYTVGMHAVLSPDFRYTDRIISWGWNVTSGGGNKMCWLTWPQELVDAKERGVQMVSIDPRQRSAAHFADEWMPIRPGTDLALALALCNVLIDSDTIDREYLSKYTNSPFLVQGNGFFLRAEPDGDDDEGKPLVWDQASNSAQPWDADGVESALEGEFTVDGAAVKPSFQLFKEHVADKTPAWAAEITGLPASQIAQLGQMISDHANIGGTIEIDGMTLPYRPVGIMAYHMAQQELGFQALRGMLMVAMLIGSMGAVGGTLSDFTWKVHKNWKGLDNISITDSPNLYLNKSAFWPINSNNSSLVAKVVVDPEKYGVAPKELPEMVLLHHVNPLGSFPDRDANVKAYETFNFVVAIDPWLSLTADLYADVVLPAATIEKYEGPMSAGTMYEDAKAMRVPPMKPMFDSRGDIDIYLDLTEAAGLLYDEGGYLDRLNSELKLKDTFALPLDVKPTAREILDRWSLSQDLDGGIEFFEQGEAIQYKGELSAAKRYGYATDPPFGGAYPHRFYGESLLGYQLEMKDLGVDKIYWQDYTPFPIWRDLTLESSPSEFDLYMTSYHMIEFKQSRTLSPLVRELSPTMFMEINTDTAQALGIADGDEVKVESQNALTGETRSITTRASLRQGIRPDTVAMPHHYGDFTVHPWVTGRGPTPNSLFFTGEGYVTNTADQTYLVKVRVEKA